MKKILLVTLLCFSAANSMGHSGTAAPEPLALGPFMKKFGLDLDKTEITVEEVADNLYVLFGAGGNIGVSIGEDGVFIVDDQFPQLMPKIRAAIGKLGGEDIDFAVSTHWHPDHAGGNLALGPAGTWLVAHENTRDMLKDDHLINMVVASYMQEAYPESAWPDITYKEDMQFHLNGERIDLMHFGPAHTTGDTAVIFRGSNAVHLGDVFKNNGYPFIDAGNGGSLDGVIRFCSETLNQINEDTVVIPGHGPIADYEALQDYVDMLVTIRTRMVGLIQKGATLEEVYAAKPTADYDEAMGDNTVFINRAYMSLTHKRLGVIN